MAKKTEKTKKQDKTEKKSWVDEIEVAGDKLVAEIKKLAEEASVRRVRVTAPDGDVAVDIPLTVGALAGGAMVLAAPVLAVVGALAAFASKVKIEVVREDPEDDDEAPEA